MERLDVPDSNRFSHRTKLIPISAGRVHDYLEDKAPYLGLAVFLIVSVLFLITSVHVSEVNISSFHNIISRDVR